MIQPSTNLLNPTKTKKRSLARRSVPFGHPGGRLIQKYIDEYEPGMPLSWAIQLEMNDWKVQTLIQKRSRQRQQDMKKRSNLKVTGVSAVLHKRPSPMVFTSQSGFSMVSHTRLRRKQRVSYRKGLPFGTGSMK